MTVEYAEGVTERRAYRVQSRRRGILARRLGGPGARSGQGVHMKKLFLATTAVVALIAVPAGAADMRVKAPVVYKPACAQFGGFYVGAHAGWGYYDHKWHDRDAWSQEEDDELHRDSINNTKSGFIGGVQGGYNWQTQLHRLRRRGRVQLGQLRSQQPGHRRRPRRGPRPAFGLQPLPRDRHGQGAHRRRGGQSAPLRDRRLRVRQLQPVDIRSSTIGGGDNETFEHRRTRWGWVAGFGTEWSINQNWSIKSEVNYARFERDETSFLCVGPVRLRTGRSASRTRTWSGPPRSASTTGSAGTHRSSRSTETCSSTVERCEGPGTTPGPFVLCLRLRGHALIRHLWRRPYPILK